MMKFVQTLIIQNTADLAKLWENLTMLAKWRIRNQFSWTVFNGMAIKRKQ